MDQGRKIILGGAGNKDITVTDDTLGLVALNPRFVTAMYFEVTED